MKKVVILATLLLACIYLPAQKISKVDFDAIKKSLDADPGLYKKLMGRFVDADSTLTASDYSTLYYGQCFQSNYNPYSSDMVNSDQFKKHYDKEDFAQALPFAMKMLEKDPMDIKMTFKALVCNHYLKDDVNKAKMKARYENLLLTIFESGDGKTAATAMVVMRVSDEYEAMANMEVKNTVQSLSHTEYGPCDVMTLQSNDLGIEKLYFNVSKLFESMNKMFKKD